MHILITGENGYLGSSIIDTLHHHHTIIMYDGDVRNEKRFDQVDMIIHMASPSDRYDFQDKCKTVTTIIEGTINMVSLANIHNAKLIFASTMGVHTFNVDDEYCSCKRAMEHYIKASCDKYLIMRIPRVYSSCRNKGLIKSLKDNTVQNYDMNKTLNYLDLNDFKKQFISSMLLENTIFEFSKIKTNTIKEIKEIYIPK